MALHPEIGGGQGSTRNKNRLKRSSFERVHYCRFTCFPARNSFFRVLSHAVHYLPQYIGHRIGGFPFEAVLVAIPGSLRLQTPRSRPPCLRFGVYALSREPPCDIVRCIAVFACAGFNFVDSNPVGATILCGFAKNILQVSTL